jgi:AcrR family transcriptional regulator
MRQDPVSITGAKLIDACERILCEINSIEELTARRIAEVAGTTASAVSYHFGSQEQLVIATAERVYKQINAERLSLLNAAVQRGHPAPPSLEDIVAALVGPSFRWSLDPHSKYKVLAHFTSMAQRSRDPDLYRPIIEDIEHHRVFIAHFRVHAPWLNDAEIGWRISCALGIRSQVTRQRHRSEVLTRNTIDFSNADEVVARIVEVVVPMFRAPG